MIISTSFHVMSSWNVTNKNNHTVKKERRIGNREKEQAKWATVWLFLFVTFHDNIILKVIEIIEFWKKILKDYENTFYNVSIKGST